MACMCGDPACPSCGPAQGFCPRCTRLGLDECECDERDVELDDDWYEPDISDEVIENVASNKPLAF